MPDVYTDRERHAYEPPRCPVCGAQFWVDWVSAVNLDQDPDDPDTPQWVRGWSECPNDPAHGSRLDA